MPLKNMGKPNMGNLKSGSKLISIPRAAPQRAGKVGQIATNNTIVSTKGGGSRGNSGNAGKRSKRMY